jgi:hypothetical protein
MSGEGDAGTVGGRSAYRPCTRCGGQADERGRVRCIATGADRVTCCASARRA